MSDQLKAEAVAPNEPENQNFVIEGEQDASADSQNEASATSSEQDKKPAITPEAQQIIAEKAFKEREARRESEALRKRVEELELASAPKAPELLSIPDRWDYDSDSDYQKAVDDYAERKAQITVYESQQRQAQQAQQQQQALAQLEQQQKEYESAVAYTGRAKGLGVSTEELQQAGNVVHAYGVSNHVQQAILNDPDGPVITKYLAANPQAIDALNNSTWLNGQEVFNKVKQAASALKPKASSTPPPADILQTGAPSGDSNPWGATFE